MLEKDSCVQLASADREVLFVTWTLIGYVATEQSYTDIKAHSQIMLYG